MAYQERKSEYEQINDLNNSESYGHSVKHFLHSTAHSYQNSHRSPQTYEIKAFADYFTLIHDYNYTSGLQYSFKQLLNAYVDGWGEKGDLTDVMNGLLDIASGNNDHAVAPSLPGCGDKSSIEIPLENRYLARANAIALIREIVQVTKQAWVPDLADQIDNIIKYDRSNFVASSASYVLSDMAGAGISYEAKAKAQHPQNSGSTTSYTLRRRHSL